MMRGSAALLLLVGLSACSEYSYKNQDNANGGDDTEDPWIDTWEPPVEGECPKPDLNASSVSIDEECLIEAIPGTFTPVVEWTNTSAGYAYTTPIVGQLTDDNFDGKITVDDIPDVVVMNTSGGITVMSGDGGAVHWTANIGGSEPSTPAIGDLDGDGFPEVVASTSGGVVAAFHGDDGAAMWRGTFSQLSSKAICGGVAIYDLDGDGVPEVVQGNVIINGLTGALRAVGSYGAGTGYTSGTYASFGVAADIDQDGDQEVVVGNALYDADGRTIWNNGQSDGFVAVGNFDDDDKGEIVVTWYPGMVRLQDDDGTVLWSGAYTGSTIGPPTVADFDNDGEPEIGVAGMGQYTVIDGNGTRLWTVTTQDFSSGFTGSAVFDFEGDGQAEVVYADEVSLWVFDGATGKVKLEETHHSSLTCSESPSIADVDNDGHAEILFTSYPYTGPESGVTVVGDLDDSWRPARTVWNQHTYAITNVDDDGGIPAIPETNWLSYNNFRSGDLSAATGGAMSDAVPGPLDVCVEECDTGRVRVIVRVGNSGVEELPAGVNWTLYSSQSGAWVAVATGHTTEVLAAGATTAGKPVDLDPSDVPDGKLRLVVDDDGTGYGKLSECHEDNNSTEADAVCP